MENLKILLFEKTAAALDVYNRNCKAEPDADWELDRRTFCALYDLVESAGLEEEYEIWKYGRA